MESNVIRHHQPSLQIIKHHPTSPNIIRHHSFWILLSTSELQAHHSCVRNWCKSRPPLPVAAALLSGSGSSVYSASSQCAPLPLALLKFLNVSIQMAGAPGSKANRIRKRKHLHWKPYWFGKNHWKSLNNCETWSIMKCTDLASRIWSSSSAQPETYTALCRCSHADEPEEAQLGIAQLPLLHRILWRPGMCTGYWKEHHRNSKTAKNSSKSVLLNDLKVILII